MRAQSHSFSVASPIVGVRGYIWWAGTFSLEDVPSSMPVKFRVELPEKNLAFGFLFEDSCVSRMKDKHNCFPHIHNPHWSKVM